MELSSFTTRSQQAISAAASAALAAGNPSVEPTHLLTALLEQTGGTAAPLLQAVGVDVATVTAEAEQRSRSGRTGVYDVTVRNQNDDTVVLFRGRSHQVRGEVLEVMAADA